MKEKFAIYKAVLFRLNYVRYFVYKVAKAF